MESFLAHMNLHFLIREHAQYGTVIDMTGLLLGHPRLSFIIGK